MEENLVHRDDLARLHVPERWHLDDHTLLCNCGQFQYDQPGHRTSSCAQDIIVLSFSTITLGVGQARVH